LAVLSIMGIILTFQRKSDKWESVLKGNCYTIGSKGDRAAGCQNICGTPRRRRRPKKGEAMSVNKGGTARKT